MIHIIIIMSSSYITILLKELNGCYLVADITIYILRVYISNSMVYTYANSINYRAIIIQQVIKLVSMNT